MHTVCSVVQQLVSGQRWETGELRCLAAAAAAAVASAAAAAVAAVAVLDKAHPTIGQSASHSLTHSLKRQLRRTCLANAQPSIQSEDFICLNQGLGH